MVLQEGGLSITITTLTDVAAFLVGWYGVPVLLRGLCVGQVVQRSSLVQEYVHVWVRHSYHSQCLIPHSNSALLFVLIDAVHRAVGISVDFLFQVGLQYIECIDMTAIWS